MISFQRDVQKSRAKISHMFLFKFLQQNKLQLEVDTNYSVSHALIFSDNDNDMFRT